MVVTYLWVCPANIKSPIDEFPCTISKFDIPDCMYWFARNALHMCVLYMVIHQKWSLSNTVWYCMGSHPLKFSLSATRLGCMKLYNALFTGIHTSDPANSSQVYLWNCVLPRTLCTRQCINQYFMATSGNTYKVVHVQWLWLYQWLWFTRKHSCINISVLIFC